MRNTNRQILGIGALYVMLALLWIVLSDLLLASWLHDSSAVPNIAKGVLFVLVTGAIFVGLLRRYAKRGIALQKYMFTAFDSFPQPLCIYDPFKKKMVDVNAAFSTVLGYADREILKKSSLRQLQDVKDAESFTAYILANRNRAFNAGIHEFRKKDGKPVFLEMHGFTLPLNRKRYVLLVGINMNEYISTLSELSSHEQKVVMQQSILKEIAWSYSHGLRKPLANILGMTALAASATERELKEIMKHIDQSARELDETIRLMVNKTYYSD